VIALAWRNLWRQPHRTLLTVSAIAFACMFMVCLLALQVGTYAGMEDNSLSLFDGYAQIQRPGYQDDPGINKSFAPSEALLQNIRSIPGISVVAPRAQAYALLTRANTQRSLAASIVGVQPEVEQRVSRIASTIHDGRYLHDDAAEAVLGEALARNLEVRPGDKVTLLGMGRDGSMAADVLTVVGLFSSGVKNLDRQLAEIPLARFQFDFAMPGEIHSLVISGPSLASVDRGVPALRRLAAQSRLRVLNWGELEPGLRDAIRLDASSSLFWYVVLVVVVIAILLNTILMSILERTREFGILLALGMRPSAVGRMVWIEILLLLFVGLAAGIAIGASIAGWFAIHGIALPGAEGAFAKWGMPGRIHPKLTAFSLFAAPVVIAVCTAIAGFVPFLKLRRLEPVAAMRAT
jgi:putative ABC transport system permease protein